MVKEQAKIEERKQALDSAVEVFVKGNADEAEAQDAAQILLAAFPQQIAQDAEKLLRKLATGTSQRLKARARAAEAAGNRISSQVLLPAQPACSQHVKFKSSEAS